MPLSEIGVKVIAAVANRLDSSMMLWMWLG
jgi:hypothetical protein